MTDRCYPIKYVNNIPNSNGLKIFFSVLFNIGYIFLCFDPSVFILVKRWSFLSLKFLGKRFQN